MDGERARETAVRIDRMIFVSTGLVRGREVNRKGVGGHRQVSFKTQERGWKI